MAIEIWEKVTLWKKYTFSDDADLGEIIETLEREKSVNSVIDTDLGFEEAQDVYDTESFVEPSDNDGESTIEVKKDDKIIWQN